MHKKFIEGALRRHERLSPGVLVRRPYRDHQPRCPYGVVTASAFGQPGVVDYRNPILAEAMRVLGLVQRYGFGIPGARRELLKNGQESPCFGSNRTGFSVR